MLPILARDRLIFALDVPSLDEALQLADDLEGLVSFFKVGLELTVAEGLRAVLPRLAPASVFVDLKLPNDIGSTIERTVVVCSELGARFLTVSAGVTTSTVCAAQAARRTPARPELLGVPYLSSMDASDLARGSADLDTHIRETAGKLLDIGCEGLVTSGGAIALLRAAYPDTTLVCPGIRPSGAKTDDHKRSATPAEAIAMGADYLVVGRPIRDAPDRAARRRVAAGIIEEIESGLARRGGC